MRQRQPRYGANLYEIRVSTTLAPEGRLYLTADTITVTAGTLMLSSEMFPPDADLSEEQEPEDFPTEIECPPGAIFALGQWYSVLMVGRRSHEVLLSEAFEQSIIEHYEKGDD